MGNSNETQYSKKRTFTRDVIKTTKIQKKNNRIYYKIKETQKEIKINKKQSNETQ